jgi:thiol-disulfide isomerase/thioredoxin
MGRLGALCLAALLGLLARPAPAQDLWVTDFEAAKTKAKAEQKTLLLDFTGSDWCIWCKKLKAEVFDLPAFKDAAPKQFVLVELDYPNAKPQDPALKAQNAKLQKQFEIRGYPTILLLDGDGNRFAQTGYQAGGADKYMEHLASLLKARDQMTALKGQVAGATGLDRAKLLDQLVGLYETLGGWDDEITKVGTEIVTLDPDNKAGLKAKYQFKVALDSANALVNQHKYADAIAAFDQALALPGLTPEQQQKTMYLKGACYFYQKDLVTLVALLKKALDVAPNSQMAPMLKQAIERFSKMAQQPAK